MYVGVKPVLIHLMLLTEQDKAQFSVLMGASLLTLTHSFAVSDLAGKAALSMNSGMAVSSMLMMVSYWQHR